MAQAYNRLGFWPENAEAEIVHLPIAASVTITQGDAVILTAGLVDIALSNSATIIGVAAESATSNSSSVRTDAYASGKNIKTIAVWGVKNQKEIFLGVTDTTGAAIVCGTLTDITGATGAMYLDASESTTDLMTMLSICPGEAVATARAMWRFQINKHSLGTID